jgi:hypothetical protein
VEVVESYLVAYPCRQGSSATSETSKNHTAHKDFQSFQILSESLDSLRCSGAAVSDSASLAESTITLSHYHASFSLQLHFHHNFLTLSPNQHIIPTRVCLHLHQPNLIPLRACRQHPFRLATELSIATTSIPNTEKQ